MSITGSEQWMYSSGASFYDHLIDQSVRITSGGSLKNDTVASTTRTYDSSQIFTYSCWFKPQGNALHIISLNDTVSGGEFTILYDGDNTFRVYSNGQFDGDTTAVFRDFSAWYHVCLVMDTTQATAANRARLYINGTLHALSSQPSQNLNVKAFTTATRGAIGARYQDNGTINYQASNGAFYIAEFIYADGVKHEPTVFGEPKSGVWIPKDVSSISLGTNGYHLDFSDQTLNTSITTNSGFGKDVRSNMPNPQWITQGNLAVHDGMPDSPTVNYATANVLAKGGNLTLAEGNLRCEASSSTTNSAVPSTIGMTTGKWYAEYYFQDANTSNARTRVGISSKTYLPASTTENQDLVASGVTMIVDGQSTFRIFENGTLIENSGNVAVGDIIGIAFDADAQTVEFYLNGVQLGTNNPYDVASVGDGIYYFAATQRTSADGIFNFGQDSTFAGATTAGGNSDENGYGDFKYAVPSGGYLALNSANLPEPAITPLDDDIPEDYFNTVPYPGNGNATQSITGVGFNAGLHWLKNRSVAHSHQWFDDVRGYGSDKGLKSNATDAEGTFGSQYGFISSSDSDGFTVTKGSSTPHFTHASGNLYVSWNWKAGSTAVSNTDGSINSSVSANTKAGFSIVSFAVPASGTFTIGHGLGTKPAMVITKGRDSSDNWVVYHKSISTDENSFLQLNSNNATGTATDIWGTAQPTSTVMGMKAGTTLNANQEAIAYCFAEVEGYSKIGSYTGNGNADGAFVYTGFRPAWIMVKRSSATSSASGWFIADNARNISNVVDYKLSASSSQEENDAATIGASGSNDFDFLSNGFKPRATNAGTNSSGNTYIYMAFAEMPFKYANAR